MYSQADIEDAIAAGALAPEQANNLRDYVAARNGVPTADEEHFRFVTGYGDVLVTYAGFFALIALGLIGLFVPIATPRLGPVGSVPLLTPILIAGGAWGLSELFLRRGGNALAGIFLSFAFALATFMSLLLLCLLMISGAGAVSPISAGVLGAISAVAAAALTWLHWRRFRVPAAVSWSLLLGGLAIILLVVALVSVSPAASTVVPLVTLLCGVGLFAYAMSWDTRDPRRVTPIAEVGLWAHWPAAMLISFGFSGLLGVSSGVTTAGGGLGVIILFLLFTLVGLIIDRRQYVAAALSPLMAALTAMFGGSALSGGRAPFGSNPFQPNYAAQPYSAQPFGGARSPFVGDALVGTTVTFLIAAMLLLLVVLIWRPLRSALLNLVPSGLRARLPGIGQGVVSETYTFQ